MSGFLQKLRIVTLGAAHDLLDREIDMNSPSALRQYVRDLEDAIGKMNSELAVQEGGVRTLNREYGDLGHKIVGDKSDVKALVAAGKNDVARGRAAIIVEEQKHFDQMGIDITNQQDVVDKLQTASQNLQAKHDLMVQRVRELERLDRDSKTKEMAATAVTEANDILGADGSESIDNLEEHMHERNDIASAKFDRAMASTPQPTGADSPEVDELLASLK